MIKFVKYSVIIVLILLVLYFLFDRKRYREGALKHHSFTIGVIYDTLIGGSGSTHYKYHFSYLCKIYKGKLPFYIFDTTYKNRKRFFIKVSTIDNSVFEIIPTIIVPDSIVNAPDNGWDTLPILITNKYEKYLLKKLYDIEKIHYQPND